MFRTLQPLLFRLDPERAHALTLNALRFSQSTPLALWILKRLYQTPPNPVQAFGLTFKNPIGLAAGYDKDALAVRGLAALGFGHVEVGTVTPLPQAGNDKPRVFRLLEDEAVINRMGFPSRGSEFLQRRLSPHLRDNLMERFIGFEARYQKKRSMRMALGDLILGVNLGKNKATPNESAYGPCRWCRSPPRSASSGASPPTAVSRIEGTSTRCHPSSTTARSPSLPASVTHTSTSPPPAGV